MTPCEHEQLVVDAAKHGRLTPEVEAHLAACADCREVHEMVGVMRAFAADTERLADRRRLQGAGQLWWKGQLARRWEAEKRAVAPLDMMQRLEVGAAIIAALILLVSLLGSLGPETSAATSDGFWRTWAGLAASSTLTWVVLVVIGAAAASAVVFRRLIED
jgi:anti-sigma factor RsiW